jgi:hypothetical protein
VVVEVVQTRFTYVSKCKNDEIFWDLNSGFMLAGLELLLLKPLHQPFYCDGFFHVWFCELLPRLASNCSFPNL